MIKPDRKAAAAKGRAAKSGRWSDVLGVTKDGVKILRPGKTTHFTERQLRNAVERGREAERSAG